MFFLSILIFLKNLFFWWKIWQIKEYRFDRISDYWKNENWVKILFNKFFLVYFLIFSLYFFIPEKFFTYWILGIFFAEIFLIFYKLFQNRLIVPKFTWRFSLIFLVSVFLDILLFYIFSNILFLIFLLNFQFLVFWLAIFLTLPISNLFKSKKMSDAKYKISKFPNLKKVWITWSYWKSTVKEFLFQMFDKNFATLATFKNQNTPLWISNLISSKLDDTFEYFFCEMWAYKKWEIEELWEIVDHKYWFLTWINNQHLSLFWSQSNIILWKSEIAKKVAKNWWVLYVNWDNYYSKKAIFPDWLNLVFYWLGWIFNSAYSEILDFSENWISFNFHYKWKTTKFTTKIIWKHNICNLTWVLAFAFDQWLSSEQIQESLNSLKTPEKNLELVKKNEKIFLINDTYNINFDWIIAACDSLEIFKNAKKILVLDDILELWKDARNIHIELWKELAKFDFDEFVLIWREFRSYIERWLLSEKIPKEKIFFNFIFDYLEENIWEWKNRQIFLFEWRHSEKYFKEILAK